MQQYRENRFGESVRVSSQGNLRRAPQSHGQPLSYVEQLEQRIAQLEQYVYKMDAIAEQRVKDLSAWMKQTVEASDHGTRCFNEHLKNVQDLANEIHAWQDKFQERFETTDALAHDVASHLFPRMKFFVDYVNEACAKPQPPVKPTK